MTVEPRYLKPDGSDKDMIFRLEVKSKDSGALTTKEIVARFEELNKRTPTTETEKLAIEEDKTALLTAIYKAIEYKPVATTKAAGSFSIEETKSELERVSKLRSKTKEDEDYEKDLRKTIEIESLSAKIELFSTWKASWDKFKKNLPDNFMKYLGATGLAITKFIALLIIIQGFLTNAVPSILSLFSIKVTLAIPVALISITALAIGLAIVGTYYFIPFALEKLGLIAANKDKTLTQIYQEQLKLIKDINDRLLQPVPLNSNDYKQLTQLVNELNQGILKTPLPQPKKSIFATIATVSMVAINAIIAYGSALSFAHSIAFTLASLAVVSPAGIPIVIGVATTALCIGLFSWLQFVVGSGISNALHPDVAKANLLKKDLEKFDSVASKFTSETEKQYYVIRGAESSNKKQIEDVSKSFDSTLKSYQEILKKPDLGETDSKTTSSKILNTIRLTKPANTVKKIKPANEPAFAPKPPTEKSVGNLGTIVLPDDDEEKESPPETETRSPKSGGKK